MGCRCAERMIALKVATSATVKGDAMAAAKEVGFVVRTIAEDAAFAARASMTVLRAAMRRGGRR